MAKNFDGFTEAESSIWRRNTAISKVGLRSLLRQAEKLRLLLSFGLIFGTDFSERGRMATTRKFFNQKIYESKSSPLSDMKRLAQFCTESIFFC